MSAKPVQLIVSANYLDRSAPKKWLIRPEDKDKGKPVSCVRMSGVRFAESNQNEAGFGCKIVAKPKGAEALPEKHAPSAVGLTRIHFASWGSFYTEPKGGGRKHIATVGEMLLLPDGSMWGKRIKYKPNEE